MIAFNHFRAHTTNLTRIHVKLLQKIYNLKISDQIRCISANKYVSPLVENDLGLEPDIDVAYICNPSNAEELKRNILRRKSTSNVEHTMNLREMLNSCSDKSQTELEKEFLTSCLRIPNATHPKICDYTDPVVIGEHGQQKKFEFRPRSLDDIAHHWRLLQMKHANKFCGPKSYFLKSALATLERALIRYTVDRLMHLGFTLVSVPDFIHPCVVEGCGMQLDGPRTQVFALHEELGSYCLSGTAEVPLCGMFMKQTLSSSSLPRKYAAVSRCYRAERARTAKESSLYRVQEFSKVEMFALTRNDEAESEAMLKDFVAIQQNLFSDLNLHFKVLEMPPYELGLPAYHKIDIEAWMPGRNRYGEISSASNCTDFQSRRLNIKFENDKGEKHYAHTVNGTACAVPRMLIAIFEQHQNDNFIVEIPSSLWPYTDGLKVIDKKGFEKMVWKY